MDDSWPLEIMHEGHIITNLVGYPIAKTMALALEEAKHIIKNDTGLPEDIYLSYYESENQAEKAWIKQFDGKFYIVISVSKVFYLYRYFTACLERSDLMSGCPYLSPSPLNNHSEIYGVDIFNELKDDNQVNTLLRLSIVFIFLYEYSHAELGHLRDGSGHQMSADELTRVDYGSPESLTDRAVAELMADRYAGRRYANYMLNCIADLPFSGKTKALYTAFVAV